MVTKKRKRKNAAFKRVKLKVGRKLKKTTTTDTAITAKKVVLISQLQEKVDTLKPLSYRGLSLDDLCKQLGHFNKFVRRDALIGTKQLLSSRPELTEHHLRSLIPAVGRLICDCGRDSALSGQLRALYRVICSIPSNAIAAHFTLLVAHLLHALTHNEAGVRSFSVSIIGLLLDNYPELCRTNHDLFTAFVKYVGGSRKPARITPCFLQVIGKFIETSWALLCPSSHNVLTIQMLLLCSEWASAPTNTCSGAYSFIRSCKERFCQEIVLKTDSGETSADANLVKVFEKGNPFDFPVITSSNATMMSPLELPESVLSLCEVCALVIATSLSEDQNGQLLGSISSLLSLIGKAVQNLPSTFHVHNFTAQMSQIWVPIRNVVAVSKVKKLQEAARWLESLGDTKQEVF